MGKNQQLQKILELSDYSKAEGCDINTWKSIIFLYTRNKKVEFEVKNTLPLILTPSKMK